MSDNFDRERLAAISHSRNAAKHRGRNHWANWKRKHMKHEALSAAKVAERARVAAFRRFKDKVRSYWRGEGDHP